MKYLVLCIGNRRKKQQMFFEHYNMYALSKGNWDLERTQRQKRMSSLNWTSLGGSVVKNSPTIQEPQETQFDPWVRKIPWRKKWLRTPISLPGESHGQRSLVGITKSDMTEQLTLSLSLSSVIKFTNPGQHTDFQSHHCIIYHMHFQKSGEEVINFNWKKILKNIAFKPWKICLISTVAIRKHSWLNE